MADIIALELFGQWKELKAILRRMQGAAQRPSRRSGLRAVGTFLTSEVRRGILSGNPGGKRLARNAPSTRRKKGFNKPLIETGEMLRNIKMAESKVGQEPAVLIGIQSGITHQFDPHKDSRELAQIGRFHEFGTATAPMRSFLGAVLDANERKLEIIFERTFGVGLGIVGPIGRT